jgi:flagellar M-ring protein FliF
LTLRGSNQLSTKQIQAIVNLVGSAVTGLTEENITVVDTAGHLLFRKRGDDPTMLSGTQLEYRLSIEQNMRGKLESMFEEIVGVGKAVARVSVELDTDQSDTTEEVFDPEAQVVRSEQLLNEANQEAGPDPAGIPGVKGNLATFNEGKDGSGGGASNSRNNVTRNYEISKTIRHTKSRSGAIKRLSVAVMVDGSYEKIVDKDGNSEIKYTPRSDDDLKRFTSMAQNAVGFDADRGDRLEVVGLSFLSSRAVEAKADVMSKYQEILERFAQPMIYLLLSICFIFFVVRPFFRLLSTKQLEEQRRAMLAKVDEEETQITEEELALKPLGMSDKERIYKLAQSDPDRAADLVRRWLRETR